jgi:hypothetical protein
VEFEIRPPDAGLLPILISDVLAKHSHLSVIKIVRIKQTFFEINELLGRVLAKLNAPKFRLCLGSIVVSVSRSRTYRRAEDGLFDPRF